jgi:hypothetical protein
MLVAFGSRNHRTRSAHSRLQQIPHTGLVQPLRGKRRCVQASAFPASVRRWPFETVAAIICEAAWVMQVTIVTMRQGLALEAKNAVQSGFWASKLPF